MEKLKRRSRQTAIGIVGGAVLIVGIIAIPYPGPGWLIVFAGLAILAQEFPWAGRVLKYGRKRYDDWNAWIKRQSWFVQSLTFIITAVVVIMTLWLLNAYGIMNSLLHLHLDWVNSPFVKK